MKQQTLSKWLKAIIIGIGICGLIVYFAIIPMCGQALVDQYPEFSYAYYPWLIFLWVTGIPCYTALVFGWRISSNIGRDRAFTKENAAYLKNIAKLAAFDGLLFFVVNIVFLFLDLNHPAIVLASLLVLCFGAAVSVAAAALSHLVRKAAELQEQSDLTI